MSAIQGYCATLRSNPDIAGLGVFIAVLLQTVLVIIAGLVFSILRYRESKNSSSSSASSSSSSSSSSASSPGLEKSGTRNQLLALSRLLFLVFDTQPIISVALYIAFIINAPGLLDSSGRLSNYHLRIAMHLQALSGIQLVAPLVLILRSTRRRVLRFVWFEIHLVFFIGLSMIQISLQRDAAQSILPLEQEARCFGRRDWASREVASATGIATLTGYLLLVLVALGHMLKYNKEASEKDEATRENRGSVATGETGESRAARESRPTQRVPEEATRFISELFIFAYLIVFAASQILIVQSLRNEYRKIWGNEEDVWGFGQIIAMGTIIPAIIDYLEAIIIGIDQSLSASLIQPGRRRARGSYMSTVFMYLIVPRWSMPSADGSTTDSDR